jgi:hypothetical protein
MVAMVQRLDARRFFFRSQLSVRSLLALFFKVFWNRLAEVSPSRLCNFGHSATTMSRVHEEAG